MSVNSPISLTCYEFSDRNQAVLVGKTADLGLSGESFTFCCWIKLNVANHCSSDQYDQAIVGQRQYGMGQGLHIVVRSLKPYFGFYGNDTASSTTLSLHTWYHLAFVYNKETREQLIFLNGNLDARSTSSIPPLQGNHDLYYSQYANGRPLMGSIAAPCFSPRCAATVLEVHEHLLSYSIQHALCPMGMVDSSLRVSDTTWPPARLAKYCCLPSQTSTYGNNADEFLSYLESGAASDAIIRCKDREFRVHKIIIGARSHFFHHLFFTSGMREQQESIVDLLDIEANAMFLFLKALYSLNVDKDDSMDINAIICLLEYSSRFQAETLGVIVEQYAIHLCIADIKIVDVLLPVAEAFNFTKLYEFCCNMKEFLIDSTLHYGTLS